MCLYICACMYIYIQLYMYILYIHTYIHMHAYVFVMCTNVCLIDFRTCTITFYCVYRRQVYIFVIKLQSKAYGTYKT